MTTPAAEPTYTLAQAQLELARRACLQRGHDFDIIVVPRHFDLGPGSPPPGTPVEVFCSVCESVWKIAR